MAGIGRSLLRSVASIKKDVIRWHKFGLAISRRLKNIEKDLKKLEEENKKR